MREALEHLGFGGKARSIGCARDDLDRDLALRLAIDRLVDDAHAARAGLAQDLESPPKRVFADRGSQPVDIPVVQRGTGIGRRAGAGRGSTLAERRFALSGSV